MCHLKGAEARHSLLVLQVTIKATYRWFSLCYDQTNGNFNVNFQVVLSLDQKTRTTIESMTMGGSLTWPEVFYRFTARKRPELTVCNIRETRR